MQYSRSSSPPHGIEYKTYIVQVTDTCYIDNNVLLSPVKKRLTYSVLPKVYGSDLFCVGFFGSDLPSG